MTPDTGPKMSRYARLWVAAVVLSATWELPAVYGPSPAEAATGSQIRDRILTRVERGRLLRAPAIGGARTVVGGGPGYESVLVGGQIRLFVRYTPNKLLVSGKPGAVVFALHPSGSRADQTGAMLGLNKLADTEGFIAVYPQAAGTGWNSADATELGDVDFLNRLADALVSQNGADPNRLYLAGIGAGGHMAMRLACSQGSRFAAYGVVGTVQPFDCKPSPPRVSLISGTTADEARKPATASTSVAGSVASGTAAATIPDPTAALARNLGCRSLVQTTQLGKVAKAKWSGCNPDADIELVRSLDRMPVDRAAPELWGFFRKFGG